MNVQHWNNYADLFVEDFDDSAESLELLVLIKDRQLAAVIKYHFGASAKVWLNQKVEALGGRTPKQCLQTPNGMNDLREMLMKIP